MEVVKKGLSVKEQAKQEVMADINKDAVKKYKAKLKELNTAKQIVKNIERELEDLEEKIEQEISDVES